MKKSVRIRRSIVGPPTCRVCDVGLNAENWYGTAGQYICKSCHALKRKTHKKSAKAVARSRENRKHRRKTRTPEQIERDRNKEFAASLKKRYGITPLQYEDRLRQQGGVCAICHTDKPGGRGGFRIDRCRKTGDINGLICTACSFILGYAKNKLTVLDAAAQYLKAHPRAVSR